MTRGLRPLLKEFGWPAATLVAMILLGMVLERAPGVPVVQNVGFVYDQPRFLAVALALLAIYEVAIAILRAPRGAGRLVAAWHQLRSRTLRPARLLRFMAAVTLCSMTGNVFDQWKHALPALAGWRFDVELANVDRWLHGGRDPWLWLQPWLGTPMITRALDAAYLLWLPVMPAIIAWQCWLDDPARRRRFLLAFVWTWFGLGIGMAYLLGSAGPVFYGEVTGDTARFGPLLAYLDSVGLQTRLLQQSMWAFYERGEITQLSAIAAMPSLHVAMAVLYVLATWQRHRRLAVLLIAFTLVTVLSCIHLGWHYAVDCEIGALGAMLIWWAAGRVVARSSAAPSSSEPERRALAA